MTRINKSKDGIIGPGPKPVVPEPIAKTTKPLKRMNKAELADVALSRRINIEGMTKKQILASLE